MTLPMLPNQIPDGPIDVTERLIKQMECPNPNCTSNLDVTNVNVGTKIQCKDCNNVTWLPDYKKPKWWQKPASIIAGIFISYVIGVASSVTASWLPVGSVPADLPAVADKAKKQMTEQPVSVGKKETNSIPQN
ncbi:BRcat domain-containing protein [Enterobacter roggenkampii]|uniref:BRcat domain-containing protein n=1 Tax=Enterobacter roggenkampii TaxID=1812935 RepID=UPI002A82BACE|nr:hypothetical protein [Enterobacter roggenkampii]